MTLPTTLITRPALRERLTAGADDRLTVVVGSAGAGQSVLLSDWAAAREAVDREAARALGMPSLAGPAQLVDVRGAQALAWFEAGRIADAVNAAQAAEADATRLGFDQHPFAVDYLRVLAGAALERRDLDTAEQLTERALSIAARFRPVSEFLALPTCAYPEIGEALYISRNTMKTHLRSIYQKLGVSSRAEAIERAVELQLL